MKGGYDNETAHGIPFHTRLYTASFEYRSVVDDLDTLALSKKEALNGGLYKRYNLGGRDGREVERSVLSPDKVMKMWDSLMARKIRLEGGMAKRRAYGVVMRDW